MSYVHSVSVFRQFGELSTLSVIGNITARHHSDVKRVVFYFDYMQT